MEPETAEKISEIKISISITQIKSCNKEFGVGEPAEFGTVERLELHHFSDASTSGYGVCSYI